jgi:acyl-ACP thioesterase
MAEPPAVDLVPVPTGVRTFSHERRVRFGDVDRHGRLRLDALAAYLQDVAADDTADSGVGWTGAWVVRRNVFEVLRSPAYGESVTVTTWASGHGSRWAERRVSIRPSGGERTIRPGGREPTMPGGSGACVEGASLWVFVDPATLRPVVLDPRFQEIYGPSTRGRSVSSRLQHPVAPPAGPPASRRRWSVRATDVDPYAHVNNAAAWAMVEEVLADGPPPPPWRAEIEYRTPIEPHHEVALEVVRDGGTVALWAREAAAGTLLLTARVTPLAG